MLEENFYDLLQVEPTADSRSIQAAYRRLMFLHHPDRNAGVDAQAMAQRLNRAYEVLSDPERRAVYDWELSGELGEPPAGAYRDRSGPSSGPTAGAWRFGGFPRPVWLAGAVAVSAVAVIVIAVVVAAGGEDSSGGGPVQVIAPVPTPNITPPISPDSTTAANKPSTGVTPAATPSAVFLFESGEAFIRNGDFARAIRDFTTAINLEPDYWFGYQLRGDSYFQLAQYRSAVEDYDLAIELNPNDRLAYSGRGRSHYQLRQYRLAIDDFDKALLIDPRFASAFSRRGRAYGQLQEFELAKLDADRACSLDSQFCSPLLSIVPTTTPAPTSTPRPAPGATSAASGREISIIVSSRFSIGSNATLKLE